MRITGSCLKSPQFLPGLFSCYYLYVLGLPSLSFGVSWGVLWGVLQPPVSEPWAGDRAALVRRSSGAGGEGDRAQKLKECPILC